MLNHIFQISTFPCRLKVLKLVFFNSEINSSFFMNIRKRYQQTVSYTRGITKAYAIDLQLNLITILNRPYLNSFKSLNGMCALGFRSKVVTRQPDTWKVAGSIHARNNFFLETNKQKKKSQAPMGFEPMTSCLLDRRSNHLSHGASLEKVCTAMSHCRTETEQLLLKKGYFLR